MPAPPCLPHRSLVAIVLTATLAVLSAIPSSAADEAWSRFHGPDGHGYAAEGSIPDSWSPTDYRWQTELPGSGVGSVVVNDDKAFLVTADVENNRRLVIGVDIRSGRMLWQTEYPLTPHPLHARNTFASTTPVVDQSRVYVAWADPHRVTVAALSHEGEKLWSVDLGRFQSQHGFGTSPVLIDGRLIILNSQQAEQLQPGETAGKSQMVALDPATGETLWATELTTTYACYGVPSLFVSPDGEKQVVAANQGDGLLGLDLETGELRWKRDVFSLRCVSSPLVAGDVVLASAGSGGGGNHLVAVRPAKRQSAAESRSDAVNAGEAEEVYRMTRSAPYVPTPALVGNRLFMVDDRGIASCVEACTGEVVWSKRIGGTFSASPVVIGDKLLLISLDGEATVLRASDTFELLGQFELGAPVQATPSWGEGCLLLRIDNRLCCLGGPQV